METSVPLSVIDEQASELAPVALGIQFAVSVPLMPVAFSTLPEKAKFVPSENPV
jgi:hypothetical protein